MGRAFNAGDRVRPSDEALRPVRERMADYFSGPLREKREREYRTAADRRGTVTECNPLPDRPGFRVYGYGVKVKWDDGRTSDCLDYMVDLA